MAIFSNDKQKATKKTVKSSKSVASKKTEKIVKKARATTVMVSSRAAIVLKAPWISEKSLIGTDRGVYVFDIPREATKNDVIRAIETIYKVVPKKVRTVNLPGKRVSHRTHAGVAIRARRRKAYVYLNKGDTIQFA